MTTRDYTYCSGAVPYDGRYLLQRSGIYLDDYFLSDTGSRASKLLLPLLSDMFDEALSLWDWPYIM